MSETQHNAYVAHHFDDAVQQKDAATLGMWLFLVTEIMFFGGLILAYIIYRWQYPETWHYVSRHDLDEVLGGINTCALLVSSLTMALAVDAAHRGNRRALIVYIIVTMILGTLFLVIKGFEYADKIHHGHLPGVGFHYEAAAQAPQAHLFYSLYFAMTGLHAFHMVIGLGVMTWLLVKAIKGRFSPGYYNPIEMSGLYWHFVDIVWIFLYPLLYLIDRS